MRLRPLGFLRVYSYEASGLGGFEASSLGLLRVYSYEASGLGGFGDRISWLRPRALGFLRVNAHEASGLGGFGPSGLHSFSRQHSIVGVRASCHQLVVPANTGLPCPTLQHRTSQNSRISDTASLGGRLGNWALGRFRALGFAQPNKS